MYIVKFKCYTKHVFTDPKKNLEQFDLHPAMRVADMGAGSGAYSLLAAALVGDSGRVYAIDVQKDLLETLKREANKKHLLNIEVIWGDLDKNAGTKLRDKTVDRIIASNILFQLSDKNTFVKEVKRILRPEGKVLVVDWTDSFGGLGPEQKSIITKEACTELFTKNGFVVHKSIAAGMHHYGIIFTVV